MVKNIQRIVDLRGEDLSDFIKIKKEDWLTDNGREVSEMAESIMAHDCRGKQMRPCFFLKTQLAYDNFGEKGLEEYFRHHLLDYICYWIAPPERHFEVELQTIPPSSMTRKRKREFRNKLKFEFLQDLRDKKLKLTSPRNLSLLFVFYHILTEDVFTIQENSTEGRCFRTYSFNGKTRRLIENLVPWLDTNLNHILEEIYQRET